MFFRNAEEESGVEIPAVQWEHCRAGLSVFVVTKVLLYCLFWKSLS